MYLFKTRKTRGVQLTIAINIHDTQIWLKLNESKTRGPWATSHSLVEIGSVVQERQIFFNFVNVFYLFRNYLPLEKGEALHLNKVESPLPKDGLCEVWFILAQWFWRRRIFKFRQFLGGLFCNYLPLDKGGALQLNKLESPSPKDALCEVWLKLAQWFWRRRFFKFRQFIFAFS